MLFTIYLNSSSILLFTIYLIIFTVQIIILYIGTTLSHLMGKCEQLNSYTLYWMLLFKK